MDLYNHQSRALQIAKDKNRVAFYHEMGLGKTYTGSEQLIRYKAAINLIVCQKSKINDWINHFKEYYPSYEALNLTDKKNITTFIAPDNKEVIGVINYELIWRRPELLNLSKFTLLLDESSLIQNEKAKRSKFILKLRPDNVILLSGTPTGGRYERLYSQLKLLGLGISKTTYYNLYIIYHHEEYAPGVRTMVIDGYKNIDRLKVVMKSLGCQFLKSDEVLDLPVQIFSKIRVDVSREYKKFRKTKVVKVDGIELLGDNSLTKLLYERQLCGIYSKAKLEAYKDLLESTNDRLIVFYNFTDELNKLRAVTDRPVSIISGSVKDLEAYENYSNSVTFIQYQAGAMGLNLQKANKIIYYTPTLTSELYEQSKKRIHRIGQGESCYYYKLIAKGSIEEKIYKVLAKRENYTSRLFEEEDNARENF